MSFMKNIKIGKKLALVFGILLFTFAGIAIFSSVLINHTGRNHSRVIDGPLARYILLEQINLTLTETRHTAALIALNSGNLIAIDGLEDNVQNLRNDFTYLVQAFRQNLDADPTMSEDAKYYRHAQITTLEGMIYDYIDTTVYEIVEIARDNRIFLAIGRIDTSLLVGKAIDMEFDELFNAIYTQMLEERAWAAQRVDFNMVRMTVVAGGAFVVAIILAIWITKIITRPINELVTTLDDVANGNLSVNIQITNQDEVGDLAKSAQTLVNTLKRLISDMDFMAREHEKGQTDTFIDAVSFSGDYADVASRFNEMVKNTLETQNKVVGTFMAIADGDFKADMEQLPGNKAQLNKAVNDMRTIIVSISEEIKLLIDAASIKGDLAVSIDINKYHGGWQDIMKGLNDLAAAVNKPIVEIRQAINRLNEGHFDKYITGDYSGDFLAIKADVNDMIATLANYVHEIDSSLAAMASGYLTRKVSMNFVGEFGAIKNSINNIGSNLHKTMSEISTASDQVLSGANQISSSAMDLANGATQQASSIQQLNASIDTISAQTKQNADDAAGANVLSKKSTENAGEGNAAMVQMLEAMVQIKESSSNISKIIKVIQDIAFQTNLLALNASVEAARAGEHGKGFAVVAEEVRNLASRSQSAATETTGLIEDSLNRVDAGSGIAESTAESLNVIVQNADQILQIINSISASSQEQAESIDQVSQGLVQISTIVQSNSAVSEETAAAAEELNSQADLLRQLVGYFKL